MLPEQPRCPFPGQLAVPSAGSIPAWLRGRGTGSGETTQEERAAREQNTLGFHFQSLHSLVRFADVSFHVVQGPEPNLAELAAAGCDPGLGLICWRDPRETPCVFVDVQRRQEHAVSV